MTDTTMIIQIVSIEFDKQIDGQSKKYEGTEIIYKGKDEKVYTKGIATTAFNYNKGLRESLESLNPKDFAEVSIQKNGSYSNWTAIKKVEQPAKQAADSSTQNAAPIREAIARTYETAEERAAKQVMIVRQSSISSAIALAALDKSEFNYEPEHIIQIARELELYVLGNAQEVKLPD